MRYPVLERWENLRTIYVSYNYQGEAIITSLFSSKSKWVSVKGCSKGHSLKKWCNSHLSLTLTLAGFRHFQTQTKKDWLDILMGKNFPKLGFLSFLMDTHCPIAWKLLYLHGQMLSNFNDGMVHLTRRLLKWEPKQLNWFVYTWNNKILWGGKFFLA